MSILRRQAVKLEDIVRWSRYILTMDDEELEQLIACDAVSMKKPHAKKFRLSVVARRTDAASTSLSPRLLVSEGNKQSDKA